MPPRLCRRCLLFGLLGLVTSVAVAWGAALRWQAGKGAVASVTVGAAMVGDRPVTVTARRGLAISSEEWEIGGVSPVTARPGGELHGALTGFYRDRAVSRAQRRDLEISTPQLDDDRAALGPPASLDDAQPGRSGLTRLTAGWPLRALQCRIQHAGIPRAAAVRRGPALADSEATKRGAIEAPWLQSSATARPPALRAPYLPIEPRFGLVLNTIFYALLWAAILLAPGALRRRIRRARGRCPKCGYSLTGQAAPGCPECGAGRDGALPLAVN